MPQNVPVSQHLLWVHVNFRISSSVKNVIGILIGTALGLLISLGSVEILTMLILPVREHSIWVYIQRNPEH